MLTGKDFLLRVVLRLNAVSCIGFGVTFMLIPDKIPEFLGTLSDASPWIFWIGVLLLVNGIHLVLASLRRVLKPLEVLYFVVGDFLWVMGSFAVLGFTPWISSSPGQVATVAVALMVGILGYLQWRFLR